MTLTGLIKNCGEGFMHILKEIEKWLINLIINNVEKT